MKAHDFPRRLAVIFMLQVGAVIYTVLWVGACLKLHRIGSDEIGFSVPVPAFVIWIKNWGWTLLAFPAWWLWAEVFTWHKEGADWGTLTRVVIWGVAVLAWLFGIAFFATIAALR